jgi:hypothetical protein
MAPPRDVRDQAPELRNFWKQHRPRGCLPTGLFIVVVLALMPLLSDGFNLLSFFLYAPWSRGDGPTLTGTWTGTVTARPAGTRRLILLLDLEYSDNARNVGYFTRRMWTGRQGRARLAGAAWLCPGKPGDLADHYRVSGSANRSGSEVELYFSPQANPHDLSLDQAKASWNGREMPFTAEYSVPWGSVPHPPFTASSMRDGIRWTSPNPPAVLRLTRTDGPAAC